MPAFRHQPVDLVLDVRSQLEFFLGGLQGAENIPVDRLPEALVSRPDVSKQAKILVYCAGGGRSAQAAERLRSAGYSRVVDGGGMSAAYAEFRPD